MEEQWLNNLKERSKSFERKAPDGLWDGVMQSLEAKGVVKAKKKLSTIWLRWAVAAAAVLLPAVIGYVALNLGDVSMRQPVTSVEKVAALPLVVANDTALKSGVAAVQTNNLPVLAARKAAVKSQGDDEMAAVQPSGRQATAQQEQETERNEAADTVEVPQQDKRSTKSVMDGYADRYKDRKDSRKSLEFYGSNHGRNEAASKWSAGVYASNMAGNDASALGYRNFTMGVNPFAEMPREETWTTDAMANIMFNNIKGDINFLLSNQPNPLMNTFDFIYRIISLLYTDCNAFIFIAKDRSGFITGFYPVLATTYELLQGSDGTIYFQFDFINGQTYTIPYLELIHLRLFYNRNDIFGMSNRVLQTDLNTANTVSQGIDKAIKTTSNLKGI